MRHHRGFTLLELSVGLTLVMLALGLGMTIVAHAAAARTIRDRQCAAREAVVLTLERARTFDLTALPPQISLPSQFDARLPGAKVKLTAQRDEKSPGLRHVHVEITAKGLPHAETGDELVAIESAEAQK